MQSVNSNSEPVPSKKPLPLRLVPREIELLEFVLDQKFSNLEALYLRFYQGEKSRSSRYAYQRLHLLQQHGFLTPVRVFTEGCYYYLASELAHAIVQGQRPERVISPPTQQIDFRTFEHDRRVMLARVHREKKGEVANWLSERRLKQEWTTESGYQLAREYMPDAIFTNRAGGRVAFELELAAKTRERLAKKVSRFLEVMKSPDGAFSRTLFVACTEPVYQLLLSVTRPYPELFKVLRYEEIVPPKTKEGG
jgi:hypothetical protein